MRERKRSGGKEGGPRVGEKGEPLQWTFFFMMTLTSLAFALMDRNLYVQCYKFEGSNCEFIILQHVLNPRQAKYQGRNFHYWQLIILHRLSNQSKLLSDRSGYAEITKKWNRNINNLSLPYRIVCVCCHTVFKECNKTLNCTKHNDVGRLVTHVTNHLVAMC